MAVTQGLLAASVADAAPVTLRGTAFGIYDLSVGFATFVASAVAGTLLLPSPSAGWPIFLGAKVIVLETEGGKRPKPHGCLRALFKKNYSTPTVKNQACTSSNYVSFMFAAGFTQGRIIRANKAVELQPSAAAIVPLQREMLTSQ
jgi:MFS family permease